jgi:Na+(H+)/acetate symporter ActP
MIARWWRTQCLFAAAVVAVVAADAVDDVVDWAFVTIATCTGV